MRQRGLACSAGIIEIVVLIILALAIAGGAWYLGRASNKPRVTETQQPAQITPSPDLNREPNGSAATANWKTYIGEQMAFSLKVPPEWSSFESSGRVDFAKENQPYPLKNNYWVWISVDPNVNRLSTEQVVDNYLNNIPVAGSISKNYLTVSGANAISLYPVPSATDTKHVYVATKENIYSIVLQAGSLPDLNQEAMDTFNMILSTLRFTSQ